MREICAVFNTTADVLEDVMIVLGDNNYKNIQVILNEANEEIALGEKLHISKVNPFSVAIVKLY